MLVVEENVQFVSVRNQSAGTALSLRQMIDCSHPEKSNHEVVDAHFCCITHAFAGVWIHFSSR